GFVVFVLSVAVIGIVVALAAIWGNASSVTDRLRSNNVPTDANSWSDIGWGAAAAATVAMLLGSLMGGHRGAAWHRLVSYFDRRDEAEHRYRGDTEVVDLRDEEERPEDLPSVEAEREREA